jgi:hypothetical protein
MGFYFDIDAPVNGRVRRATVTLMDDDGSVKDREKADLDSSKDREKLARRFGQKINEDPAVIEDRLSSAWNEQVRQRREHQKAREAGSPDAADQISVAILDQHPETIRRPLCCLNGRAYAATWINLQVTVKQEVDAATGAVTKYDPPLVKTTPVLMIVRDDGKAFVDGPSPVDGCAPLSHLGAEVFLSVPPPPDRAWSGAGVKRFLKGERPNVAETFWRIAEVVNRFIDFKRSLASQDEMCELVACYILATWLLDAFNVFGYLWPNGDRGAGKTTFLQVSAETAYLGQLILAGGSYAPLRDLADYGASLAFDDAENIMDVKRADPDKRTLLLAGNRRGASVTVKEQVGEQWVTRYVNAFCPRQFSAIRLPDDVLGSRTIVIPLVRSGDENRAKANPLDYASWPHDRRRLIDDLWATALVSLPQLREYDRRAASESKLIGRELEPWRSIFAVALWLQEEHDVSFLFERLTKLADRYRLERSDLEVNDPVRVAIKALARATAGQDEKDEKLFEPKELAGWMNTVAVEDGIAEEPAGEKAFTNSRKVGWMLRRLRFRKGPRDQQRHWKVNRSEVEALARAYGMTLKEDASATEHGFEQEV